MLGRLWNRLFHNFFGTLSELFRNLFGTLSGLSNRMRAMVRLKRAGPRLRLPSGSASLSLIVLRSLGRLEGDRDEKEDKSLVVSATGSHVCIETQDHSCIHHCVRVSICSHFSPCARFTGAGATGLHGISRDHTRQLTHSQSVPAYRHMGWTDLCQPWRRVPFRAIHSKPACKTRTVRQKIRLWRMVYQFQNIVIFII